jgi:large repetitive protein
MHMQQEAIGPRKAGPATTDADLGSMNSRNTMLNKFRALTAGAVRRLMVVFGIFGAIAAVSQTLLNPFTDPVSGMQIVQLIPVKKESVGSSQYLYTYKLKVSAGNQGVVSAQANLASTNTRFVITDGVANSGMLQAQASAELADSISVRAPGDFDLRFNLFGQPLLLAQILPTPSGFSAFQWRLSAVTDNKGPEIADTLPQGIQPPGRVLIRAQLSDVGAGLDTTTLSLKLNGQNVTSLAKWDGRQFEYAADLRAGLYKVQLGASDKLRNAALTEWSFEVKAPEPEVVGGASLAGRLPQFMIVDYIPVSKVAVPNVLGKFDYTYRVTVRNSGAAVASLEGVVRSKRTSVVMQDGNVNFGPVAAKQAITASDLFTVRANAYFDRRLDRTVLQSGQVQYAEVGSDADDGRILGLSLLSPGWAKSLVDAWYMLKFSWVFDWALQAKQDVLAPQIGGEQPIGNLASALPLIKATYSDDGGVNTGAVTLLVDGVNVTPQAAVTSAGISYTPTLALAQGTHQVLLSASDNVGNTTSKSWSFFVDTVAPVVSAQSPKDTNDVSANVAITAMYADAGVGIQIESVKLTVDGADVTSLASVDQTGVRYQPANKLTGGTHTVKLNVKDVVGNASEATWSFGVDATAPQASQLQPAEGTVVSVQTIPALSAQFEDAGAGIDPARVKLWLDGVDVTSQAQINASGFAYTPAAVLSEGIHVAKLLLADRTGNTAETQWRFTTRDAPVISQVSPKDVLLGAGAAVTISASYTDVGAGIDASKVSLLLDGVDVTALAQISATALTFTPASPLPQGEHWLTLTVTDKAGNAATQSWRFALDNGLPYISNEAPKGVLISASRPVIGASFEDTGEAGSSGIDQASVRLVLNGIDVTQQAQLDVSSKPGSIRFTPTTPLTDGPQTVRLTVKDKAGNAAESTWDFSVDAQGPGLEITSPAAGQQFPADALLHFKGTFTDLGSGVDTAQAKVLLDGQDITSLVSLQPDGWVYNLAQPMPEGDHTLFVLIKDRAGNAEQKNLTFKTTTPPLIEGQSPKDTFLPGGARPQIVASFSDIGSGIDATQTRLMFNGVDVTAQATVSASGIGYLVPEPLLDAAHSVKLTVADRVGNSASSEWTFATAQPPEITTFAPQDEVLPHGVRPRVTATFRDSRVGIDLSSVKLFMNGQDVTAQAQVTASGISFVPPQPLASGPYTFYLEVANTTNTVATKAWWFEVAESSRYDVTLISPGQQTVIQPKITVTATASSNSSYPTELSIFGKPMQMLDAQGAEGETVYGAEVDLIEGTNTLQVQAKFADGTLREASTQVFYSAPATVTILSPADKAVLGPVTRDGLTPGGALDLTGKVERPVTVTGRVSKPVVAVTINQQQAVLEPDGLAFSFPKFFLREGTNLITAVARDAQGRVSSSSVTVSVDQTAPILRVEAPGNKAVTSNTRIDIRGMANDAVEGLVGAPEPTVAIKVNGQSVQASTTTGQVSDEYFLVPDVPLELGENLIEVSATDHLGNVRTEVLQVNRVAVGSSRLTLLEGNHQTGKAGQELVKPLTVVALNASGEPLVDWPVQFDIDRGTGSISLQQGAATKTNGATPARNLVVKTDQGGRASVWMTLGKLSGPGANVVKASHPELTEEVFFTASTQRGDVAKVNADLGTNQIAETNAQPLELLSVVVRDKHDNTLPNVPVVFTVEEGDASLPDTSGAQAQAVNGKLGQRIVLSTDKNGITALRPLLGNTEGIVRIKAQALKQEGGSVDNAADLMGDAVYTIQVRKAQDGPTTFSGYVYDDKGQVLSGVKFSIGRTNLISTSDETGRYVLENVPPGRIDLFVDGRTVNPTNDPAKPQYPSLHFEAYAVKGRDNQLAHPIYLPPLLVSEAKVVGGNEDVILKIPGLEGFQMKVKANSVTFPDGSRTGALVVSPVTADRLPMAPPAGGGIFGVPAWTVQPSGTRFDPPIEVTLPNATSQPPGDNLPIVQWDHDLGQFVPMGRATVSEDGAVLITDSGSGITKAGWGGLCVYDPNKCGRKAACSAKDCKVSDGKCGCKDSDDKCKDGKSETTLSMDTSFITEPINALLKSATNASSKLKILGVNADFSLSVSADGSIKFSDKCCKSDNRPCNAPPVRVGELSGTVGVSAKSTASFSPAILSKFAAAFKGRYAGYKQIPGGIIYGGSVKDISPEISFTLKGSLSASGAGAAECRELDCKSLKGSISMSMKGQWNPGVEFGVYAINGAVDKGDPLLDDEGKPGVKILNPGRVYYVTKASADVLASIKSDSHKISGSYSSGKGCSTGGASATYAYGGIDVELKGKVSFAVYGMASGDFEIGGDPINLIPPGSVSIYP